MSVGETGTAGRRFRVVIADDSEDVRRVLRRVLEPEFEIVGEAADGVVAVTLVEEQSPDLLLLDLAMPKMDGLQVLEQLRAAGARVRVVVFSGYGGIFAEAARDLGAVDYVEKGMLPNSLIERLRRACA